MHRLKSSFPKEKAPPLEIAVPVIRPKQTNKESDPQEQLLD